MQLQRGGAAGILRCVSDMSHGHVSVKFLSEQSDSRWAFDWRHVPHVPVVILSHGELPAVGNVSAVWFMSIVSVVLLIGMVHENRALLPGQPLPDATSLRLRTGQSRELLLRPV